jgi:hypothetical protein
LSQVTNWLQERQSLQNQPREGIEHSIAAWNL